MVTGTVFDIKEFAQNDGDGVRTTVFFKGCPLRCIWCHNPEGLSPLPELYVGQNGCENCGLCRRPCSHDDCKPFGRCLHICPHGLLRVSGREYGARELAEKLKKSADFLEEVGGITLSGGEPLLQWEFALALIRELKPLNIAVETSGYADLDVFKAVISECDLVMIDVKLADREAHKKYTGVYNDKILENLAWLKKSGKSFLIRVPLIPGITDTDENIAAIAKIADGHPVELLPYNDLAGAKYPSVGKVYTDEIKYKKSRITDTAGLPENFRIR